MHSSRFDRLFSLENVQGCWAINSGPFWVTAVPTTCVTRSGQLTGLITGCHKPASFCPEDVQDRCVCSGFHLFSCRHLNARNSSAYVSSLSLQVRERGIAPRCLSLSGVSARDSLGEFSAMSRLGLKCVPFRTQGNRTITLCGSIQEKKPHYFSLRLQSGNLE